jgi:hypothetical protein
MNRRFMIGTVVLALTLGAKALLAHDDYRIIGTVEKVTAKTIDVKQTKDGKVISMQMTGKSIVTRDKQKVGRAEVKADQHVVVDARGDSLAKLFVVEVRLVPAPSGQ